MAIPVWSLKVLLSPLTRTLAGYKIHEMRSFKRKQTFSHFVPKYSVRSFYLTLHIHHGFLQTPAIEWIWHYYSLLNMVNSRTLRALLVAAPFSSADGMSIVVSLIRCETRRLSFLPVALPTLRPEL